MIRQGNSGSPNNPSCRWFVKSVASKHMCNNPRILENMVKMEDVVEVGVVTLTRVEGFGL